VRSRVDLTALARGVAAEVARGYPRKPRLVVQEGLTVEADERLVRVVLENLLSNAFKFSSHASDPAVDVGREEDAFFVRDNGAGFDEAHAGRLFEPFTRLHKAEEFPGTGVGLAIVHRVVRRHGGKVWARSAPGAGASFYFTLG
jgi:signal transduction histidine kinase